MTAFTQSDLEALARGEKLPREVFDAIVRDPEAVRQVQRLMRVRELFAGEPPPSAPVVDEDATTLITPAAEVGTVVIPGARPAAPGLEGFEFLEALGSGAFGQVWKARDVALDRLVAVKVVASAGLEEGRALAKLPTHRNRAQVFALHPHGDGALLVMELVRGRNLLDLIRNGPLPWPEATRYAVQIAEGLREVHRAGILHRDVKPGNVVLDEGRGESVLVDFGLAAPPTQNEGGGTPAYLAPEAWRGEASPRSDVYSLGVTLLHLVTGRLPRPPAVVPADLPRPLRELLESALEQDEGLRIDLETFLARARRAEAEDLEDRLKELARGRAARLKVVVLTARGGGLDFRTEEVSGEAPVRVRTGDLVRLEVTPNEDGYVTVLCFGSGGGLSVLFSGGQQGHRTRAGQTEQLSFRAEPPAGADTFAVVWSMQPWAFGEQEWRRLLNGGSMPATRGMTLVQARTLREDETWSAATVGVVQEG
jgi:hypothetical protein